MKFLDKIYSLTPGAYAARMSEEAAGRAFASSEAAQIRAEQRERDYNSPSAQMRRYAQAGLNPALMYGGGSPGAAGNVGSSAPTRQAPTMQAPTGILQMLIGGIQMGAQIANVASQSSLRAIQREVGESVIGKNLAQTQQIKQSINYLEQVNPSLARIASARAELGEREAEIMTTTGMTEAGVRLQNLMAQKGLLDVDNKIRLEILKSKTIEAELLQLERDFIKDGDFNSKQFWQGFLMLMTRVKPR